MSNRFKLALVALAVVLIGLSVNRYLSGGGIDWFSGIVALGALALLAICTGQSEDD